MKCVCGKSRVGAARQKGKYLYYDCCEKIYCFPLPRECYENPISAANADPMVWDKLAELMSSEELLLAQAELWLNSQRSKVDTSVDDVDALSREMAKLKKVKMRFEEAYGNESMTLEEMMDHVRPIKEKMESLKKRMALSQQQAHQTLTTLPTAEEIKAFAEEARKNLSGLSFEQKRAIVLGTVEEIVGNQAQLVVRGNIAVSTTYGRFKTKDRNRGASKRREVHSL